jgi:hypothetical protein
MRTPDGIECPYFFGDYYRGRHKEECRLLKASGAHAGWKPVLCKTCPVPGITRANACPNLDLHAEISSLFLWIGKRVTVKAFCKLTGVAVKEPHIGCGQCHPLPAEFIEKSK